MTGLRRYSPIHEALVPLRPRWIEIAGMPAPLAIAEPAAEIARAEVAGISDATAFARLTVRGPEAAALLAERGFDLPPAILDWRSIDDGGLVARTGAAEFFLEDGPAGDAVARIEGSLG